MIPTPRLAAITALGAILWMAAAVQHAYFYAALAYGVFIIIGATVDWFRTAAPSDFEVTRHLDERMNLGAPNLVHLRIHQRRKNNIKSTFNITIRDEAPQEFLVRLTQEELPVTLAKSTFDAAPSVPQMQLIMMSGRAVSGRYWVTPSRRGDYQFGDIILRYPSPWKLWQRQMTQNAGQMVRVYPDTSKVRQFELRLHQGRLRGLGLHLLKMRGQGTEFESLREYVTDDEFRNINWKASARQGKLIATNYQIERDQMILIALDCGRMMTALSRVRHQDALAHPIAMSKLDWTINASALLTHVALAMGDAVGLLVFADHVVQYIPPHKGASQKQRILETLYRLQPSLVEPDYRAAYTNLLARKLRRALVVTFTDIVDPETSSELLTASTILRRRHNSLCITINNQDVMEMAAAFPADISLLYQKAMAVRMLNSRRQVLEKLRQQGVGILDVTSAQLTLATVNRYLELKARAAF